jgi:UDP-N-acetylmuramoyl-tripeptide--D-alanyl-D-alanine ligase
MPRLKLSEIAGVLDAEAPRASVGDLTAAGYAIDTRLLRTGDLFFALKGEARDGHEFVADACEKGAVGAVVERAFEGLPPSFPQMIVRSPLEALQRLAGHVRLSTDIPVIAVTGSNGKTTTKEMIAFLLAARMRVRKSPGNFNNHIGLPLAILGLDESDRALVVEIGSSHRGEIASLARIARPQIGVITNVGRAHIGLFGSLEAVAAEKTDLARCLEPGGEAVVNADDDILMAAVKTGVAETRTFGIHGEADFRATGVRVSEGMGSTFTLRGVAVTLRAPGLHNVYNALAAIATAGAFGLSVRDAAEAIRLYEPMRMKTHVLGGMTLVDDTYNSNPDSAAAALDVLAGMRGARRVFIMGDMLELGEYAQGLHREMGTRVARSGIELFVGIGSLTRWAAEEARSAGMRDEAVFHFETKAEARAALLGIVKADDAVLVKASRAAGLDEIADFLKSSPIAGRV